MECILYSTEKHWTDIQNFSENDEFITVKESDFDYHFLQECFELKERGESFPVQFRDSSFYTQKVTVTFERIEGHKKGDRKIVFRKVEP